MATAQLQASRFSHDDEWFRVLAESSTAAVVVYGDRNILFTNSMAHEITGYTDEEFAAMEDPWLVLAPEFRMQSGDMALLAAESPKPLEVKLRHSSGDEVWAEVSAHRVEFDGQLATLATIIDITAHRRAEKAMSRDKELAHVTLSAIGDGVIRTDSKGQIDYMNPVAEELTGWPFDKARDRPVSKVYRSLGEGSRRPRPNPVDTCLSQGRTVSFPGIFTLQSRDGKEFTVRDSASPIQDSAGEVIGAVLVIRDLTRLRGLEKQMVYLTSHDALTGLLNRQEFEIHLEMALESVRDQGNAHTLLYIDVIELKLVNDCYGMMAGDELLRQIAEMLQNRVAELGTLGRVAGDDFGLLLHGVNKAEAQALARDLLFGLDDFRFTWGGQQLDIGLSIGLVEITPESESAAQLIKIADASAYSARQSGRNQIHTYSSNDPAIHERHGRLQWVQRIHRALAENRFVLYHQEIRPLRQDLPPLHEILLRMVDDDGTHLPPGTFIPVAESHNLASALDRWVVRRALDLLAQQTDGPLSRAAVSINLSGQSLGDEAFVNDLLGTIAGSDVDPRRLFFEITETAAVANPGRTLQLIETLKATGCRFVLDDFGSGFCSFAYLKDLPVDLLKIDGAFVRSMVEEPVHEAMVSAVHKIGNVMGLETIAEWIEDEATLLRLEEIGVDYGQGYLLHRPEPIEA